MRVRIQFGLLLAASCLCLPTLASMHANVVSSGDHAASNMEASQQPLQQQQQQQQQQQISNAAPNQPLAPDGNNNPNPSIDYQPAQSSPLQQNNTSNAQSASQQPSSSSATALNDSEMTTQIQAMIMGNSALLSANIRVMTHDGNVTLEGTATSSKQVDDATKAAQSVFGVKSVTSNIQVQAN